MRTSEVSRRTEPIPVLLDRWVDRGLLEPNQARRILQAEGLDGGSQSRPRASSLGAAEAAGYVGGALVVVACTLLGFRYWDDMSLPVRAAIALFGAVTLLGAGLVTPAEDGGPPARLRSVLWLCSTGALTAFLALVAHRDGAWSGEHAGLTAGAGAAVYASVLWVQHRTAPVALAVLLPLLLTAGSAGTLLDGRHTPALAAWAAAAGFAVIAATGRLGPLRWPCSFGAVAAMIAAATTIEATSGLVLAVLTALAVVGAGVAARDFLLLGLGVAGTVVTLPFVVDRWFGGIGAGAPVLLLLGGAMIVAAVHVARAQHTK
jgi:hypothetical protein